MMRLRSGKEIVKEEEEKKKDFGVVELVDVDCTISDDEREEYLELLKGELGADTLEWSYSFVSPGGLDCIALRASGTIGKISMKRLGLRLKGWKIMWKQDYLSNYT